MSDAARALLEGTIADAARTLRDGDVSVRALVEAALERARAIQPQLNAFVSLRAEAALAHADSLDREARAGRWRGPLHGIPLAHKDCFERADAPASVGSIAAALAPGARDAAALERLRAAGAIDLGPLNLNEAVAGPTGQNPHLGDCRNARDPRRVSGGSSSGSGASVAAGAVFGSLGSDTGGSIRLPASMNGLVGLKPTQGRTTRAGCVPRAFSLDCIGPLARTAADCALLLHAIAGADPRDPSAAPVPVPDYAARLADAGRGSRLAVLGLDVPIEPDVAGCFERLVRAAGDRHGAVPTVRFDGFEACYAMADTISKVEAATLHGPSMRARPGDWSQAVYSRTEPGLHVPAVRYLEVLQARAPVLRDWLDGPMREADVVLLPTVPVPVPTLEEADMEGPGRVFGVVPRLTALTRPFSYLGVPVLTMPIGLDRNGLPVGAQLVGRPFGEARLLAVAHALGEDIGWDARPARSPGDGGGRA